MTNQTVTQQPGQNVGFLDTVHSLAAKVTLLLENAFPGKVEYFVVGAAIFIGYQAMKRLSWDGDYGYWFKASIVVYILLKIAGFGVKLI